VRKRRRPTLLTWLINPHAPRNMAGGCIIFTVSLAAKVHKCSVLGACLMTRFFPLLGRDGLLGSNVCVLAADHILVVIVFLKDWRAIHRDHILCRVRNSRSR
jgi:hypothetical protein